MLWRPLVFLRHFAFEKKSTRFYIFLEIQNIFKNWPELRDVLYGRSLSKILVLPIAFSAILTTSRAKVRQKIAKLLGIEKILF
jgi:hypothetical protein